MSIISLWWSGYTSLTNSIEKSFKIWQNPSASSMPVKMQILVAPLQLMSAHTWTLAGCLGWRLGLGCSPLFPWQNLLWDCIWIEASSVQMTSSNWHSVFSIVHARHFILLGWCISWHYTDLLNVQPKSVRLFRLVQYVLHKVVMYCTV